MRKKILLVPLALLLAISLVAAGCPAPAPTPTPAPAPTPTPAPAPVKPVESEYQWSFGLSYPMDTSYGRAVQMMGDLIEQYSDGRIEITYFPGGVLGGNPEIDALVMSGDLELAYTYPYGSLNPALDIVMMPFLLGTRAQSKHFASQVYNGIQYDIVSDAFAEIGIKYLSLSYNRLIGIGTVDRPVRTPDDLAGLKIRSYSLMVIKAMERMGAVAASVPIDEAYTALQTGVIDGTFADPQWMLDAKFYEVAKYVTDLNQYATTGALGMNLELYNSLPDDIKEVIDRASYHAELYILAGSDLDVWRAEEEVKKFGVTVIHLTDEERQAFIDLTKPEELWDEYMTEALGADTLERVKAEAARIMAQY